MGDLQSLLDEKAIEKMLARFSRIIDDRRWEALADVFATDLSFDYGEGSEKQGLAALQETMARYLGACGGTQHLLGNILVELNGDRATSRTYVQARHQRPGDAAGPIFDSNGEYVDDWERGSGGWRIVRRRVSWMTHSGDPAILAVNAEDLAPPSRCE